MLGETVCSYIGAGPPCNGGDHRYLFLLFHQDSPMGMAKVESAKTYFEYRGGLRSCEWAASHGMGKPIGKKLSIQSLHCRSIVTLIGGRRSKAFFVSIFFVQRCLIFIY